MADKDRALENAVRLLEESEKIVLTDDFNRAVLARLQEDHSRSRIWYKSAAVLAVSLAAVFTFWSFRPDNGKPYLAGKGNRDLEIIEHLDILEKMEVLEHLDVYSDTASLRLFLQLLEK
ncbi:hypothetical protein [Desulfomarina sp.]